MAEKRKPHYPLAAIMAAFANPATLNRTASSKLGARDLGMSDGDVVAVVQALSRADFDKAMTSYADPTVWQDVYKPSAAGRALYVKFTLDAQKALLLISFKDRDQ
jgi:motility quorum-sensing regulator / GCU-specific mRNA interferase toxin